MCYRNQIPREILRRSGWQGADGTKGARSLGAPLRSTGQSLRREGQWRRLGPGYSGRVRVAECAVETLMMRPSRLVPVDASGHVGRPPSVPAFNAIVRMCSFVHYITIDIRWRMDELQAHEAARDVRQFTASKRHGAVLQTSSEPRGGVAE